METMAPLFSCVIPTNRRVSLIEDLLISLRSAKSVEGRPLEILLVDDSPIKEAQEIQDLCRRYNARYLEGPASVREKRNLGIVNAHGEYVFFIDSDCQADKNVFEEHYKILSTAGYDACIGITNFVGEDSPMWHIISQTKFLDSFRFPTLLKNKVDSAPWGPTTNLSVRKKILDELGGFETNLPFKLGADDADLGLRINRAGFRIGMSEAALVFHSRETWNGMRKIMRRVFRWGRMDYYLYYCRHREKTAFTMPKPISVFSLLAIVLLTLAVCSSFFWPLCSIFLWWPCFLWLFSYIKRMHWKMQHVPLWTLMGAEFINQVFDWGCLVMSLRHGSLACLWREPIDDPRNLWHTKIHLTWASCLATFIVLIIACLWSVFQ